MKIITQKILVGIVLIMFVFLIVGKFNGWF